MTKQELIAILEKLLDAYVRESAALNDPREPQRYREWALELVAEAESAIAAGKESTK